MAGFACPLVIFRLKSIGVARSVALGELFFKLAYDPFGDCWSVWNRRGTISDGLILSILLVLFIFVPLVCFEVSNLILEVLGLFLKTLNPYPQDESLHVLHLSRLQVLDEQTLLQ
jgi:hypothetical protein